MAHDCGVGSGARGDAGLREAGPAAAATVLGGLLVVACAVGTVTNFCLRSPMLSLLERRSDAHREVVAP